MTREEIMQLNTDYLNDCESEHEMNELFYFALELQKHEHEPCEDAISRQAVLDLVNADWKYENLESDIANLPPVTPQPKCKDAISRQVVEEQMIKYGFHAPDMTVTEFVEDLPPVNPQPKIGHWIDGKCNRCGTHAPYWAMATTYYCSEYCPNCGARMQEVIEE